MIATEFLEDRGVLMISPKGPLEAADFERVAREIDPVIARDGALRGLMIVARSFPGWRDFGALLSHLRFVRDHHRKVRKVAAVSDGGFLAVLPAVVGHFVNAEVRHFDHADKAEALAWLTER
ncbi:MAG TPA: STAS/SEC14 domain-containing protein [Alphaproteobacteria bacterium]|jgi:hypothetical protein